ncbi:putative short-chain dehydrogenase/oxidoreductase [Clavulina sp. PMI_390]|nr:putative short-chain dehydrogenase/oxidoreductase [Clavulina sp. PMI_390]
MPDFVETSDTVLVIGATSGIGKALAVKLHQAGKTVIVTGRRQERLDELSKELDHERVFTVQWDISDLSGIKAMANTLIQHYGSRMNAVVIVSGLQRTTDFTNPEGLDFTSIQTEITTNFTAYIHLIAAFLPHLTKLGKTKSPWIGIVSSELAIVPMSRTPVYNGTKAAIHQAVLSIRRQLEKAGSPVSLVEVFPPITSCACCTNLYEEVATELHDVKNQPDLKGDTKPAMPLDEFTEELWQGLEEGKIDIPCGRAKDAWEKVDAPRQELFRAAGGV